MDDQSASVGDTDTEDEEWVPTQNVPTQKKKRPATASSTSSKQVLVASSTNDKNNVAHKNRTDQKKAQLTKA